MKTLTLILILALLGTTLMAQDALKVMPYGVSPAMIKADTLGAPDYLGILDRVSSGLLNVGVETKVYLKGMRTDKPLTGAAWNIAEAPAGSAAEISQTADMDASTQIATFVPDVVGKYVVTFADGGEEAEVVINAGQFTGIKQGACAMCHKDKAADWQQTGHASMLTNALNGQGRSGTSCLSCHTTGFDNMASNGGFDDYDFEYPANPGPGVADQMAQLYPQAMALANIQCESCHGPGGSHYAETSDNKMVSSLAVGACAQCHDDDHYHVYPSQWKTSAHANPPSRDTWSAGCARCHTPEGFIAFAKGETVESNGTNPFGCAVCHDPHSAEHENQLRTMQATLANGEMTPAEVGKGALCMNCHQSRRDAATYTNQPGSHYGPHYAPQADMLIGTNVATFGKTLPTSPHISALENACVDCHMHERGDHGEHDDFGNLTTAGMHSFSMVDVNGVDNVIACSGCHGDVGESFDHKKFYMNGNADHDGDGVAEGLQEEVHGLMDILGGLLPDGDPHAEVDTTWTLTELKASYNHRMVYYDHSYGIHNPAFIVSLLKVSIQALINNAIEGDIVAIDDVPNDQGKKVRIIWDKMVDDGVSVDPIEQYIVKRLDMDKDVWVNVGQVPADGSNRYALVVPTLYDSTATDPGLTSFVVVALTQGGMTTESTPAAGYSVDNLIPMAPTNVVAQVIGSSNVKLTWDDPVDEDFNYFGIYRSTQEGFEPMDDMLVATTTGVELSDATIKFDGTYYYKVCAFDFAGNRSESSNEVIAKVTTGIAANSQSLPTEFTLDQNYPNPFNPTTSIRFGVPTAGDVKINVYDIRGVHVRTLASGQFAAGYHTVTWDGRNDIGLQVANGTYMYRLETESHVFTKKMVFLK